MVEGRHTLPGTKLPQGDLPPTLLFHRWHRYDCFVKETYVERGKARELEPFKRNETAVPFLRRVADRVQEVNRAHYEDHHGQLVAAFKAVEAERKVEATTAWRLVVGWGTNPAFETGLVLDHLLGYPYVPGSAVKGLVHRVAEDELLESRDGEPAIPAPESVLPEEPPEELVGSVQRSLRVRALFGSIHLRRNLATDPEPPFERLQGWLDLIPKPSEVPEAWREIRTRLERLCSKTAAGGMVTCFDALPAPAEFGARSEKLLTPDVLTPHGSGDPKPVFFLAVRQGATFELRFRLAPWSAAEPRDDEERERAAGLTGTGRQAILAELRRWLIQGLSQLGLGGKTSAGYGYLDAQRGLWPALRLLAEPPVPVEPEVELPAAEGFARLQLPDDIDPGRAVDVLDRVLEDPDPERRAAVARRFIERFGTRVGGWRGRKKPSIQKRLAAIDEALADRQGDGS